MITLRKTTIFVPIVCLLLSLFGANIAFASEAKQMSREVNYDKDFFNELRLVLIEDELKNYGISEEISNKKATLSFEDQVVLMEKAINQGIADKKQKQVLLTKVDELSKIDVTYTDIDTGKMYNSQKGFIGYSPVDDSIHIDDNIVLENSNLKGDELISPNSQSNPTPSEIYGGTGGAFERRQLGYSGFDKITSNMTLPTVSNITTYEQCWVYYGFDAANGTGVEGGMSHQTGSNQWAPYIRVGGISYPNPLPKYSNGAVLSDFNFLIKKATSSDTYYTAFLSIGTSQLYSVRTNFTSSDISTMSVKRLSTIAVNTQNKTFNGSNILTKSSNQKFSSLNVRKYNENVYKTWGSYTEYSKWQNNMWYGTVNCTPSYIHKSGDTLSIYK